MRTVPLFWSTQPWFDPDNAPLNPAALFVGVAASLESLGRAGGEPEAAIFLGNTERFDTAGRNRVEQALAQRQTAARRRGGAGQAPVVAAHSGC